VAKVPRVAAGVRPTIGEVAVVPGGFPHATVSCPHSLTRAPRIPRRSAGYTTGMQGVRGGRCDDRAAC
jgi:hypothetical protein